MSHSRNYNTCTTCLTHQLAPQSSMTHNVT